MLTRRRQLAAKIETEEGTLETLTKDDAKLIIENPIVDIDPPMHERAPVGSSLTKVGDIAGKRIASLSFSMKLRGSGLAAQDAEWFKLLRGCGWKTSALSIISIGPVTGGPFLHGETITGGTSGATGRVVIETADGAASLYFVPISGTFQQAEVITGGTSGATTNTASDPSDAGRELKPISDPDTVPSLSLASFEDGVKKSLKGVRGKVKLNFKTGEPTVMEFEYNGAFAGIVDESLLTDVTHETTIPPCLLNAFLSIGGFPVKASEVEIDWANTLGPRDDVNEAEGVLSYVISDRKPAGSFMSEMEKLAGHDFIGKWIAGDKMVLDVTVGSQAGNKFRFYIPKAQYTKVADEDREGIAGVRASFLLTGSLEPGDDELTILSL